MEHHNFLSTTSARRLLMSIEEFFSIEPPREQIGIPCGRYLCVKCCVEKYMICGAEIDCDESFNMKLVMIVVAVLFGLMLVVSYLLFIKHFGNKKTSHRMAQIIFNKQYQKMHR